MIQLLQKVLVCVELSHILLFLIALDVFVDLFISFYNWQKKSDFPACAAIEMSFGKHAMGLFLFIVVEKC